MLRRLVPVLAVLALVAPATAQAGDVVLLPDASFAPTNRLLASAAGFWGGEYIVPSGERVNVFTSDEYPENEADNQAIANFLASAFHGPELSTVTIYRMTEDEINANCGTGALACYSLQQRAILTPADDISSDISRDGALLHEYGHHVAGARRNPPWDAIDWGTKRWASYLNICALDKRGSVFPGAQDESRYPRNPGEGFAEVYRLLNERQLGLPESSWRAVSTVFSPNAAALRLARTDILQPWTRRTTTTFSGRLAAGRSRTFNVTTALDGDLDVKASAGLRLELLRAGSRLRRGTRSMKWQVCGQRSLRVRITATRATSFRLRVLKP